MIRIVIVGEIRLYRDGLAEFLGRTAGFEVVGCASDRLEAFDLLRTHYPDIILLDMATQGSHDAVRVMKELAPQAPVIALGVPSAEGEVLRCAEAGVAGYVSRDATLDALVATIGNALNGEVQCSPQMAGSMFRLIGMLSAARQEPPVEDALTGREREILHLIEQGHSNKEIARSLGIEVATVKNHVHNLLDKLHVHRRGEAAARFRGRGTRQHLHRQL